MDFSINQASSPQHRDLFLQWLKEASVSQNLPAKSEAEYGWWLDFTLSFIEYGAVYFAYEGSSCIGVGALMLPPYEKLRHHSPLILLVDPKKRRRGVGHALLEHLCFVAKHRFAIEVLSVEFAAGSQSEIAFFEKRGFTTFARMEGWFANEGSIDDKICMEKELRDDS